MSVERCDRHDRHYDTDFEINCKFCEEHPMETPITDKLERDINEWYEGEGREAERLTELLAQLRTKEAAGQLQ